MEWMLMPYRRYFDFSGRSRRMEYWMFALLSVIVSVIAVMLMFAAGFPLEAMGDPSAMATASPPGALFWVVVTLFGIWALASIIPSIAVTIRRLHDRDMSGWWYLGIIVLGMIPIVGIIANIGFLVLMFLEGTKGPNRFGPDPKDQTGGADVFA